MDEKQLKEVQDAYQAIIDRKDKEIERLKQENMLLMKSSLKRADELEQMRQVMIRLQKRNSKSDEERKNK